MRWIAKQAVRSFHEDAVPQSRFAAVLEWLYELLVKRTPGSLDDSLRGDVIGISRDLNKSSLAARRVLASKHEIWGSGPAATATAPTTRSR